MKNVDEIEDLNEFMCEMNIKVTERLEEIEFETGENCKLSDVYKDYFNKCMERISNLEKIYSMRESGKLRKLPLSDLQIWNEKMYGEFYEKNYSTSYGNPTYAVEKFGMEIGQLLSAMYYKLEEVTQDAYLKIRTNLTIVEDLFIRVYDVLSSDEVTSEKLKKVFVENNDFYYEISAVNNIKMLVDPKIDCIKEIINTADLSDTRFLYWYGLHVSDNEIKMLEFISKLPKSDVQAMADTFTEGYRIGFEITGKDITKKKSGEFIYALGLEPVVKISMKNFEKINLKSIIGLGRVQTSDANRQLNFDHREDMAIVLDENKIDERLKIIKKAFELSKEEALGYAGPAVIETFGEKDFNPVIKKESISLNAEQRETNVNFISRKRKIQGDYIIEEERSFTIIAYPVPEIGADFEEIFRGTVKLNNLDYTLYQTMQQEIIDALDTAQYVHVVGKGENKTDIKVSMHEMTDPSKQTNFENCVADVNIPVGEVFTSPKLVGTNGKLHVTKVYLNGLLFKNLEIDFVDGMIDKYTCTNFKTEEENKKYMDENVLFNHKTLPIGEFAIGTNTEAYKMGIEYDIQDKLPILIAEKTGPHFAVGDTCYSHVEDVAVFNPDGKEIVARENEVVAIRKTEPLKAYFNCHTDITIPYNELKKIVAVDKEGKEIAIIEDGKFILAGIEKLNEPLYELEK